MLLRPSAPLLTWGWLPLLAGVALARAVTAAAGVSTALKWPNDLLAGDGDDRAAYGKVAGILAQTSGDAVIIGIGLNVSTGADELPFPGATSLALSGAGGLDRTALLAAILAALDRRYSQWTDVDGDAAACGLAEAYREACATIGQQVRVSGTDAEVVVGRAVDIDAGGRLRLDVDGQWSARSAPATSSTCGRSDRSAAQHQVARGQDTHRHERGRRRIGPGPDRARRGRPATRAC